MASRFFRWLDARYNLAPLVEFARHKEVPMGAHSMVWYYLGGTTLFFFLMQIGTGLLLLLYYQPGENTAYESIRHITTQVPFGWLVRSLHCWSAHLMIVSLVVHMLSTLMLKAYRPPRELTWVSGYLLFAVALGFGFSGYLLPWNELAFFATSVGTDSVKSVPVIGDWLLQVMRGGPDVTIDTVYRFFALHVVALPLTAVAIIGAHLLFVQRQGMALPVGAKVAPRGLRFFPNFVLRDVLLWLVCLMLLTTLAVFVPYGPGVPGMEWELGNKADPMAPAFPGIKPEWYFLWIYQLLKEFPPHLLGMEGPQVCLLVVTVLMVGWALIPWLDRKARRDQPSPAFSDVGVAALIFIGFLTLKAWDIGVHGVAHTPEEITTVARTCAIIAVALALAVSALRVFAFGQRWLWLSGAATLHVALHGLGGLSYLTAGTIAFGLAVTAVIGSTLRARRAGGPA